VSVLARVVADLAEETEVLMAVLSRLGTADCDAATPAEGWTIRDQVAHLAYFDDATLLALSDPAAFVEQRAELLALGDRFPDAVADRHRALTGGQCLAWLARSRTALLSAYLDADADLRLPWYGPDMGLASSATGRLMETWAHGQDIADTVGQVRQRRNLADPGLRVTGPVATEWISIAQAFAGAPGCGRPAGLFDGGTP
jgi:uncharacterized protein (TIGR03084 family)